jgi:tetratricopeptide (TPR) repeat protein
MGRPIRGVLQKAFCFGALLGMAACATTADEYYARGQRALGTGNLQSASDALHRCIEKDPTRGDAYLALGNIYLKQEKWSPAANAFREAMALDDRLAPQASPLLLDALYQDAQALLRTGREREAIDSFRELYEKAPDYPKLRRVYADLLVRYGREAILRGHYGDGVDKLQEALRVEPGNKAARRLLEQTRFASQ